MIFPHQFRLAMVVALLGLFGAQGTASAGFVTYHVVVNTTSLKGISGSLEFQDNPAMTLSTTSTAVVSAFTSAGGLVSPLTDVIGSVSGSLASPPMTITANTGLNDILEDFTFGTSFAFNLTLNDPALVADRFSLTVWPGDIPTVNSGTINPVLTIPNDMSGAALTIDYTGASASVINSSPQVSVSVVPEPSSMLLMAAAGSCLLARRGWNRRRRAA